MLKIKSYIDLGINCRKKGIKLEDFNEPVEIMDGAYCEGMFRGCHSFNQDVIIPENVYANNISNMFLNCYSFNSKVTITNPDKVDHYIMTSMFQNCVSLETINLDISNHAVDIFHDCYNLKEAIIRVHKNPHSNNPYIDPISFRNCINLRNIDSNVDVCYIAKKRKLVKQYNLLSLEMEEFLYSEFLLRTIIDNTSEDIMIGFYMDKHDTIVDEFIPSIHCYKSYRKDRLNDLCDALYKYEDRKVIIKATKDPNYTTKYIMGFYINLTPEEYAKELLLYNLGGN